MSKVVKSEDVQTRTDNSFLRLIYLASRHRPDGQYFDADLAERTSYSECDALLRKEHIRCFLEYMSLPVKRQIAQMLPYLRTLAGEDENISIENAIRFAVSLVPVGADSTNSELFMDIARGVFMIYLRERLSAES